MQFWLFWQCILESKSMLGERREQSRKMSVRGYVSNVAQKSSIMLARNVIQTNNFYARFKTTKINNYLVTLRYLTLTTSSTFPQFHSKKSPITNQIRKHQWTAICHIGYAQYSGTPGRRQWRNRHQTDDVSGDVLWPPHYWWKYQRYVFGKGEGTVRRSNQTNPRHLSLLHCGCICCRRWRPRLRILLWRPLR